MFKHITKCSYTWSRQLYYRQQLCNSQHLEFSFLKQFYVRTYTSNSDKELQLKEKKTAEHSGNKHQSRNSQWSGPNKKLYKARQLSSAELEEERRYQEDEVVSSTEDDVFGSGVQRFTDNYTKTSGKKKKDKSRGTVLPKQWSETFGTLDTEGESFTEESVSSTLGSHNERLTEDLKNEGKEPEFYNHIRLARYNRKHVPNWYARKIQYFGKKGQIQKAIEVFDKWMIEQDRVKPTAFEFGVLIKLLGHAGYTKKAFKLYKKMLEMKIYANEQIYTSLFNACSNSPWSDNGLSLARKLRLQMVLKEYQPKLITYQAMIKAFGTCGDINTAFSLADEAAQIYGATENLLNSLLIACITDKAAGFRHALLVWRKFRSMGIQPTTTSYNLLLRAVNECGIGTKKLIGQLLSSGTNTSYLGTRDDGFGAVDMSNSDEVITQRDTIIAQDRHQRNLVESCKHIDPVSGHIGNKDNSSRSIKDDESIDSSRNINASNEMVDADDCELTCVLTKDQDLASEQSCSGSNDNIRRMEESDNLEWWQMDILTEPSNSSIDSNSRLVPGMSNVVLEDTRKVHVPDILDPSEQFSSIISVDQIHTRQDRFGLLGGLTPFLDSLYGRGIDPDIVTFTQLMMVVPAQDERLLLSEMGELGLTPDTDFLNHLMHKRCMRKDISGARAVSDLMSCYDLTPNLRTYGILALTCKKRDQGLELLSEMDAVNLAPNAVILGSLIHASDLNFPYKGELLTAMTRLGIKPNMALIRKLEHQISKARQILVQKDRGELSNKYFTSESFERSVEKFIDFYDNWGKENNMEEETHPWEPFRSKMEKKRTAGAQ